MLTLNVSRRVSESVFRAARSHFVSSCQRNLTSNRTIGDLIILWLTIILRVSSVFRREYVNKNMRCVNCGIWKIAKEHTKAGVIEVGELPLPEQLLLFAWLAPTPVPPSELLCFKCQCLVSEAAARGGASRAAGHSSVCCACGRSILRSRWRLLPPPGSPHHTMLTEIAGDLRIQTREQEEAEVNDEDPRQSGDNADLVTQIVLEGYMRVKNEGKCCVISCESRPKLASLHTRRRLLRILHLYVPPEPTLCAKHQELRDEGRNTVAFSEGFSGEDIADAMLLLGNAEPIDFEEVGSMDEPACRWFLGVGRERFAELLGLGVGARALAIGLAQHRGGDVPSVLASKGQLCRSEVVRDLAAAASFLARQDVKEILNRP